ncbi:MAG TPA: hypothetical protein ACQGQI_05925 [Xylella sp.]
MLVAVIGALVSRLRVLCIGKRRMPLISGQDEALADTEGVLICDERWFALG